MKCPYIAFLCIFTLLPGLGCQTGLPIDIGGITGSKMSDEEKIALVLDDVQKGMEGHRIYRVLSHVARSYKDRDGRDYEMLRKDLNVLLRNYRAINITRTPPRVQVSGDRARVVDTFGAVADSASPIKYPPVNLQGQVIIMMERFGDTWQIVEWGMVR